MLVGSKTDKTKVGSEGADIRPALDAVSGPAGAGPADVGANLRHFRTLAGLSLDALGKLSGVSRAMLGQIETGKSVPTVTVVWKIAQALGITVSALVDSPRRLRAVVLPRTDAAVIGRSGGHFTVRRICAPDIEQGFEFQEMRLAPGHCETLEPRFTGGPVSLAVAAGTLELTLDDGDGYRLSEGDAILFDGDVKQSYFNPGRDVVVAYLVCGTGRTTISGR